MTTINVHSHLLPASFWQGVESEGHWHGATIVARPDGGQYINTANRLAGPIVENWRCTPEERLRLMDRQGVDVHLVSVAPYMTNYHLEPGEGLVSAREVNEDIAAVARANPQRLIGLATVPLQDPPAAAEELERTMLELGFKGAEINTNVEGHNLDEPQFFPFFEAAERLGAFLFFHPHSPAGADRTSRYYLSNTIVRYAAREDETDLMLLHLLEPHLFGEDYADSVVELLKYFGVKRYSLVGGMYDMVPHTRPLRVSGFGTGPNVQEENNSLGVRLSDYEGPTTILSLVPQEATKLGMETRGYVIHLPQYLQVDEDLSGTARLMEILCSLYQLPERLIQRQRGEEQYSSMQNMVKDTSEVSSLLERLEEQYDREQREAQPPPPLPPNIEDFLRELDQGFTPP